MRLMLFIAMVAVFVSPPCLLAADSGAADLYNVAEAKLGATAKGSGAHINKDWKPQKCLGNGRGTGTIASPVKGLTIDIHLVLPVPVTAVDLQGLDYRGTRLPKGVDIYIDGKKVASGDMPNDPGKFTRIDIPGSPKIQNLRIVCTSENPRLKLKDGKLGATYGGFGKIKVLSPVDVAAMMTAPKNYDVKKNPADIQSTTTAGNEGVEVKVIGRPRKTQGHPNTIWDQQDIDHYKKMLKTSPKLQEQFAGLKRGMDKRITQPVGVLPPLKGKDGKYIHNNKPDFRNTNNRLALDIANLGTMYALTGEEKYADFAKKILLAYADVYENYVPGNRPGFKHDSGKCFDQRLGDATWLIQVARGYDLIYNSPGITPEERKHIQDKLIKASANFIAGNRGMYGSATNWSAIANCSILIAGYATDDQALIDLAMTGKGGKTRKGNLYGVNLHFSGKCIDADGMWAEGAMGYQMMAMEALIADAEILWHHGIDMYRHRNGALKCLFDSPLQFSYPNLKTPAIHDSGHGSILGNESFLWEFGYRRYGDPTYRMILDQAGTHLQARFQQFPVSVLFDRDPNAPVEAIEWKSVNLFGVGYGILRNTSPNGTISLLLDYGPNRSHGHPDKLNIDLWAFGDRLIPDPGSIWYENPIYKRWYHTTLSHNTLIVDELDQMACGAEQITYGSADTMGVQRAQTAGAYAGVTMDRSLFLTSNYMADIFGAFGELPRKMDLAWHIRGDFKTDMPLKDFKLPEPRENGYNELKNVQALTTDGPYSATFTVQGGKKARFIAAGGQKTQVIVGDGILGNEQPKTILQRRLANKTLFGNVVDLSSNPTPYVTGLTLTGSLEDGCGLLEVKHDGGADLCFTAFRPGDYNTGGLKTDAQQVFVLRSGGKVQSMFLAGGTTAEVGDVKLWRDKPGLAYVEKADNGAYILANPSPEKAEVRVTMPALKDMTAYSLDADGKRTGEAKVAQDSGKTSCTVELAAKGRVEFAKAGAPSVYEYRQSMLKAQAEKLAAELAKAKNEATVRTKARQAAAEKSPLPANTVIAVQAEDFTGQGGGKVAVSDKKKAAVGKAFSGWNAEHHWLEYTVDAPQAGYYNMALCYCSQLALGQRSIKVNGEEQEPFVRPSFPATGGWANGSDDWKLFIVENPVSKKPLLIKLNKGKNVIRLTNTNGKGVNMDYIALFSPDVKPTREMIAKKLTAE